VTKAWPAPCELLPHAGGMLLIARVVAHTPQQTCCEVEVAASALFVDANGAVPAWVALEWMAQCAAAHGGLAARAADAPRAQGMLVGARRLALARRSFALGETLRVTARGAGAAGALVSFECEVRDERGSVVASGSISVVVGSFSVARA
jgi:predicted hotdog family 3-hydroxylacyl-ACP dehydratase